MSPDKNRRLSDKIIAAHNQACEEKNKEVAELLLRALEVQVTAIGGADITEHRKSMPELDDAFLRHEELKSG